MPRKKKSGAAAWKDPDGAPELTDAFFDRAEKEVKPEVVKECLEDLDTLWKTMIQKSGANVFVEVGT
jgi:hypothetical protein